MLRFSQRRRGRTSFGGSGGYGGGPLFSLLFILLIFLLFSLKTLMRVVDAQQQREPASRESIEKFFEAFDEGEKK